MILYKQDNTKNIRTWEIVESGLGYEIMHGLLDGTPQYKEVEVHENGSGRSWEEQVEAEVNSRIKKQRDKGYVDTVEQARYSKATNALNMPMPMLAQKYKQTSLSYPYYIQMKYDGNRCIITKKDGVVQAYSRNGKRIFAIPHILEAAKGIPEGMHIDGELYHHGTPLQTIRSWIAKEQTDSNNLVYMCYDIMTNAPYSKRLERLKELALPYPIKIAETSLITSPIALGSRLNKAREEGYEGLILRVGHSGYEDGKRSKSLIKVKKWLDCEVVVLNIIPSKDGWARLSCRFNGKPFVVSCHGTIAYKEMVMKNKIKFIGRTVTIEYANLTVDGVPFHPTAIAFREEGE